MKKKVLTTAMALAMLAPTATTFASTTDKTITGPENIQQNSELQIQGQVHTNAGTAPEGQISVTLPTTVSFVVDKEGNFIAPNTMTITNNSSNVGISVSVASFTDSTQEKGKGITVVNSGELSDKDRSFVSLSLVASSSNGGSTVELLSTGVAETELVDIDATSQAGLSLAGQAGKQSYNLGTTGNSEDIDQKGSSDQFSLVFKIAKK